MSYGYYSQVYYATTGKTNPHFHDMVLVKVGETTNTARRNRQLTDVCIVTWQHLEGSICGYDETARKFVESFVRAKVSKIPGAVLCGVDHFFVPTLADDAFIQKSFAEWVTQAISIWENL